MPETPRTTPKKPWLIRMHHQMRSVSFAMLFVATGLQIVGKGYSAAAWGLLVMLFLVYPHLQYWRASRAENFVRVEMANLRIDSLLLGMFIAALGFSLWLAFSAMVGTLINNAVNKGWRSVGETLIALSGGAALWIAIAGFSFSPATEWSATLFCIVGLAGYLAAMGNLGFVRNRQLRSTREALKAREKELLTANETLSSELQKIDALQAQLREQAVRDPLTGLYNRRYLDSTLERELARCKREGQPLSLIMIDIDHFKKINDTYGHQAGDEVLKELGATLSHMARAGDLPCRYGGEEFFLLMPTMSLSAALERAEELRGVFGAKLVAFGDFRLQATLSLGISVYPGHGTSASELIRCADGALYRAKLGGRNQVRVAPDAYSPVEAGVRHGAGDSHAADFIHLLWRKSYEYGHPLIDEQHRALFVEVNKLFAAVLSDCPAEEISSLVETLVRQVVEHFQTEEKLITGLGLPGAAEHVACHRQLVERAAELVRRFRAGELDVGELFQFLAHDMIARHILGADREVFHYLQTPVAAIDQ